MVDETVAHYLQIMTKLSPFLRQPPPPPHGKVKFIRAKRQLSDKIRLEGFQEIPILPGLEASIKIGASPMFRN